MNDHQNAFAQFLRQALDDRYDIPRDVPQELLLLIDQLRLQD